MSTQVIESLPKNRTYRQTVGKEKSTAQVQSSSGSVIWALDPNEKDVKQVKKVWEILNLWTFSEKKILPVTVLSPIDFGWPMKITSKFRSELIARANEKSEKVLGQVSSLIQKKQILVSADLSLLTAVRKFLRFGTKLKAEMLVLFSRESSASRFTGLGSFSEIAVATSKLPIMIITEKDVSSKKGIKISFSNRLFGASEKSFSQSSRMGETTKW